MAEIHEICTRCGNRIVTHNGAPCTREGCNKLIDNQSATDYNDTDDYEDDLLTRKSREYLRNRREENQEDEENQEEETDEAADGAEAEGCLSDLTDGCFFSMLKIIWKIISFPFKIIFRILDIFD